MHCQRLALPSSSVFPPLLPRGAVIVTLLLESTVRGAGHRGGGRGKEEESRKTGGKGKNVPLEGAAGGTDGQKDGKSQKQLAPPYPGMYFLYGGSELKYISALWSQCCRISST